MNLPSSSYPSFFQLASEAQAEGNNYTTNVFIANRNVTNCLPQQVSQSLNRYGRVDLTGGTSASCK